MFVSTFTDPNATALVLSVSLGCDAAGIEVFFFNSEKYLDAYYFAGVLRTSSRHKS